MANSEHLEILKQGVEVWNKWRKNNPNIIPDLSGSHLNRTCLIEIDFSEINLSGSDLSFSYLIDAKMVRANLYQTDLATTDLRGADLEGANLREADLTLVNFYGTKLTGADFESAIFHETKITFCSSLARAKNLDKIRHSSISILDINTLRSCVSELPYTFLNGVGYANQEIEILKAQYSRPIKYYSCFISYSSKDEEFTKDLHSKLRDANITVWFAPEDLKIGDKIRDRINEQIRIYDKLLIVLSKNSVNSSWVKYEVETALNREIKENKTILFPIRLDDSIFDINESWAVDVQSRHIGDFRNWKNHDEYKKSLERLIKDLKAKQK